jgi:uroporphyrinogen-III synthase
MSDADTTVANSGLAVSPPPNAGRRDAAALAGFTVAITADRRRDEFAGLLERRGARIVLAPALRIVPIADDAELHASTTALARQPPSTLFVSTGIGMRGWLEAAEGWGLAEPLRARIAASYLVARGPKARGAIRAAGLVDSWSPESESCDDVLDFLIDGATHGPDGADGIGDTTGGTADATRRVGDAPPGVGNVAGKRIAMQLHGEPQPEFTAALREAGADVIEIPVYRWAPPIDSAPLRRLVDLVSSRLVDAVTFTSAPAVGSLLRTAGPDAEAVLHALRTDVVAACVGPVTAAPLRRRGVPVVEPGRARLGALVRALVDELPRRARTLSIAGAAVTLRGHAAVVDGRLKPLAPAPMAVLRALADCPGRVLSRAALLHALPRGADEHAVEMAVARLRAALGGTGYVQTVVKRGYRLRVD